MGMMSTTCTMAAFSPLLKYPSLGYVKMLVKFSSVR